MRRRISPEARLVLLALAEPPALYKLTSSGFGPYEWQAWTEYIGGLDPLPAARPTIRVVADGQVEVYYADSSGELHRREFALA